MLIVSGHNGEQELSNGSVIKSKDKPVIKHKKDIP